MWLAWKSLSIFKIDFWRLCMKKRFCRLMTAMAIIFFASVSFAQNDINPDKKPVEKNAGETGKDDNKPDEKKAEENRKEDKKFDIGISGLIYMEWVNFTGYQYGGSGDVPKVWKNSTYTLNSLIAPTSGTKNEQSGLTGNTFRLQRVYLNFQKEINELLSVRVTTDINTWNADRSNLLFMKFAWLQAKKDFGPVSTMFRIGLVDTPVTAYIDRVSDFRWISSNFIENSKTVLNGNSFDNTADFGGNLSLEFFKIVRYSYSFTNGEGYKNSNNETYKGKAHTMILTVAPIKELNFNIFGRSEDTDNKNIQETTWPKSGIKYYNLAYRTYQGAGIAFVTDLIKTGSNIVLLRNMAQGSSSYDITNANLITAFTPKYKKHFTLSDSWVNFNLGALVPDAPVLLVGRFVYGKELPSMVANKMKTTVTIVKTIGLGWQFNNNVRVVGYYENIDYRITQKQTGVLVENISSFPFPADDLHATNLNSKWNPWSAKYVGYNRNPKAANNFYVKAEVKF